MSLSSSFLKDKEILHGFFCHSFYQKAFIRTAMLTLRLVVIQLSLFLTKKLRSPRLPFPIFALRKKCTKTQIASYGGLKTFEEMIRFILIFIFTVFLFAKIVCILRVDFFRC